jgi:acyl-CoA thioesterase
VSPSPFAFDVDTALERLDDGRYRGTMTDRWTVGAGPNGGYVAAFALRAVLRESTLPDPLSMTVHYLARPGAGPVDVLVETLRVGRGHTTLSFRLVQGEIKAAGIVTLGRHREPGPYDFAPPAPEPGLAPEASLPLPPREMPGSSLWRRLDLRISKPEDVFYLRETPGEATTGGWTRFADGRPVDALAVPLFLDCWPPAVFCRTLQPSPAGTPTLELTVHWRDRPGPGWHRTSFETRLVAGGYMDENGELWSEDGRLVAESRQLARY